MYYELIRSLDELLGEDGLLGLPKYLAQAYVFDSTSKSILNDCVKKYTSGQNILIEGIAGTGKTALMFMILRTTMRLGYNIGYIINGATEMSNKHMEEGILLFCDDLPQYNISTIKSMISNKIRGIIATGRTEEIDHLKMRGVDLRKYFSVYRINPKSDEILYKILLNFAEIEGIDISDKAIANEVVKKAMGLPIYIWQVVRDLKIRNKKLDATFIKETPAGMLNYVDEILWRVLHSRPERYEIILTLRIMVDLYNYSIHQDVFNYVYLVAREKRLKQKLEISDVMFDDAFELISRYLMRGTNYSFKLPHDTWADVLRGKSTGPLAPEIAKVNILFNHEKRREILVDAVRRALSIIDDKDRRDALIDFIKKNISFAPNLRELIQFDLRSEARVRIPTQKNACNGIAKLVSNFLVAKKLRDRLDILSSISKRYRKKGCKDCLKLMDVYNEIRDEILREAIISCIGNVFEETCDENVLVIFNDIIDKETGFVKATIIKALGKIFAYSRNDIIDKIVFKYINHWTPMVRASAIWSLGKIYENSPTNRVREAIISKLNEENKSVLLAAIEACGKIFKDSKEPSLITPLINLMSHPDKEIRKKVLTVIGLIYKNSANTYICEALYRRLRRRFRGERDKELRALIMETLIELSCQERK